MRALRLDTVDENPPAVFLDYPISNGKAKAGSFARAFCGEKRIIYLTDIIRRNSYSRILDVHHDHCIIF